MVSAALRRAADSPPACFTQIETKMSSMARVRSFSTEYPRWPNGQISNERSLVVYLSVNPRWPPAAGGRSRGGMGDRAAARHRRFMRCGLLGVAPFERNEACAARPHGGFREMGLCRGARTWMRARTFSDAYEANRRNAAGAAFEADAVAVAIADFIREDFPAGSERYGHEAPRSPCSESL